MQLTYLQQPQQLGIKTNANNCFQTTAKVRFKWQLYSSMEASDCGCQQRQSLP